MRYSSNQPIIIGSRGSQLALWQAVFVQQQLQQLGYAVEIRIIKTQGDVIQHLSFEKMEGKGFFTKELEESLLKEEIDVAVHSYKDLPTQQPEGLCIAANSYRENPCDCLLIRRDALDSTAFWQLKAGAIVGTSSPRRTALLQHFRPDVQIQSLRGNVPTRISKLEAGYDAVLLAAAGLERLQLDTSAYQVLHLPPQRFVPAPAQGVLALQTRSHDTELRQILAHIHCPDIAETTAVERHLLQLLEGGCREPMGAYCTKHQNTYQVWVAFSEKNAPLRRVLVEEQSVEAVAASVWNIFKNPRRLHVFISREVDNTGYFAQQMRTQHHQLTAQSLVTFRALPAAEMPACDWVFFTSSKGVEFFAEQTKNTTLPPTLKWAALGAGTAATLRRTLRIEADFCGNGNATDAAPLFEKEARGQKVLFPQAANSLRSMQELLSKGGQIQIKDWVIYDNTPATDTTLAADEFDVLIFTSPLNVDAFVQQFSIREHQKIIAIGDTTAQRLQHYGYTACVAHSPDEMALAAWVY